uniref:Crustin-like-3 protein n=1 Tax=Pagurus bernhardus TaxID=174397 RepID=W6MEW2_PAGBR
MLRVTIVLLAVALSAMATIECDHWCKAPGDRTYCCGPHVEGGPHPPVEDRPIGCPSSIGCPFYPRGGPTLCPHDGFCLPRHKCCYDACLEHHTCQRPDYQG